MKHIEYFNRSIEKMFKQSPFDKTLEIVEDFRRKREYKDYYQALDNLGLKVGVEYLVQPVFNEQTGEAISFISSIKFHNNNPLTGR